MTQIEERITIKLFIGCLLTPEIKLFLEQSKLWQQQRIGKNAPLTTIHFKNKEYIGTFISQKQPSLAELQKQETTIKTLLAEYCPEFNTDTINTKIFSQVFLT